MSKLRLCVTGITLLLCVPVFAADPTGSMQWSAGEFRALAKTLATKMDETKSGAQPILTKPTHNALVFHREGTGEAEIHERFADFLVVRSGEGVFQVGGKIGGTHNIAKDEIRGKTLEGGTKYKVTAGDVVYIPANVPHRTLVDTGKQLNVLVIKVQ
jgi:mannose-6-phosphate isomerase-like protein (cupin superfamily)